MPLSPPSAYEQAVDEQRTRLEFSQLRRETDLYLKNVEHSKQVSAIIDRKKKRGDDLLEVREGGEGGREGGR